MHRFDHGVREGEHELRMVLHNRIAAMERFIHGVLSFALRICGRTPDLRSASGVRPGSTTMAGLLFLKSLSLGVFEEMRHTWCRHELLITFGAASRCGWQSALFLALFSALSS